jgi:hypothetical protein
LYLAAGALYACRRLCARVLSPKDTLPLDPRLGIGTDGRCAAGLVATAPSSTARTASVIRQPAPAGNAWSVTSSPHIRNRQ